jgi:ankyrin repeat protein
VPHEQVVELVKLFAQADFFSLADKYELGNSEGSYVTTSIEIDGRRKQLLDISGIAVGMPLAAQRLEEAIDRIAVSERWVHGNAETLAALQAEHWDLTSHAAAVALARLADFGDPDVALDLVHAGAPLDGNARKSYPVVEDSCCTALEYASMHGDLKLMQALLTAGAAANAEIMSRAMFDSVYGGHLEAFHLLLANGAAAKAHDPGGRTLLMAAASSGSPAMLKEILKSDHNVNANTQIPAQPCESKGPSSEAASDCSPQPETDGRTALLEATYMSDDEAHQEQVDRPEVVRLLLAAGADVNARDANGDSALLFCHRNLELASLLLQAGADPNVRNHDGDSPLQRAGSDEMQRLLIRHGAISPAPSAEIH